YARGVCFPTGTCIYKPFTTCYLIFRLYSKSLSHRGWVKQSRHKPLISGRNCHLIHGFLDSVASLAYNNMFLAWGWVSKSFIGVLLVGVDAGHCLPVQYGPFNSQENQSALKALPVKSIIFPLAFSEEIHKNRIGDVVM